MATRGGGMGVSSFPSSHSCFNKNGRTTSSTVAVLPLMVIKLAKSTRRITCSAAQETSTSTSTSTVSADAKEEVKAVEKKAVEKKAAAAPPKPKAAAKAPVKPLPQLMEEEVIPSLKSTLEADADITALELSFQDNRLEGSFVKKGFPYSFWAFFPKGVLTGPKGFSLSSYGFGASTVEPFLIDEKKITAKHVVFWVEKRLAAQGIIPVWKE